MNKSELNQRIFDEILKYAASKRVDKIADELLEEELTAKYTLTQEFEKKMSRLFVLQKKRERNIRIRKPAAKIAAVLFIFFSVSIITIMNVEALRVNVLNFISEVKDKSTTIYIGQNKETIPEVTGIYLPSYLPKDYVAVSLDKVNDYYIAIYKNSEGDILQLQRLPGGFSAGVDSEDSYNEQLIINGESAEYFLKNNIGMLVFRYNGNIFLLSAPLFKDELIQIAESMKYINN
jgi:hypothetical protein